MQTEFQLTILGKSSAVPTATSFPSSQALHYGNSVFLIDCGEGCQVQLRKNKIAFKRIRHIFISHLHGDHFYGLFGLLSTMDLLGRKQVLHLFGHEKLQHIVQFVSTQAGKPLSFPIVFYALNFDRKHLILETKNLNIYSFPLRHRIPTCGFLFEEKTDVRNLRPDAVGNYEMNHLEIRRAKQGKDLLRDGKLVAKNEKLCFPPNKARSYAYCSDTTYDAKIPGYISSVGLLYHEATFGDDMEGKEESFYHSTARQAARVAKKAAAGKLILGHFSTRYKTVDDLLTQAKEEFENTVAADENLSFQVGVGGGEPD